MKRRKRKTTKVLVVDDNEAILHVVGKVLEKNGYSVISVTSGIEALEKIKTSTPDLAIIDLSLSDMNGMELIKFISARSPTTKRLILTGTPTEIDRNNPDSPRILLKPLTGEELLAAVKETLNEG